MKCICEGRNSADSPPISTVPASGTGIQSYNFHIPNLAYIVLRTPPTIVSSNNQEAKEQFFPCCNFPSITLVMT